MLLLMTNCQHSSDNARNADGFVFLESWSGGPHKGCVSVFCPMSLSFAPQTGDVPEV
jgi:hypothetical protein